MARATWLADVLTAAGLTIKPYPGWETRGRNDFEPVGLIWHHTVTSPNTADTTVDRMLAVTGSSTTPAPLCNYSTNRDGTISIIAAGTANHGGAGGWQGKSGNRLFLGDEMKNRGTNTLEPWPAVQLESARVAAAAVLDHIRRDASWLCGHKEYALPPGRKSDPHTLVMDSERARVAALMENGVDEMTLKRGDSGNAVNFFQNCLNTWRPEAGLIVGSPFDTKMEGVVKNYQGASDLPQTGEIDGITATLLAEYREDKADPPAGSGGLNEAQVKAIVNQAVVHVD